MIATFVLSCKHTVSFQTPWPTKGQHVNCMRCRMDRVIEYRIREFSIRCSECHYYRTFGTDKDTAQRRAVRHARERAHDVTVCQGDVVLETISGHQDTVIYL